MKQLASKLMVSSDTTTRLSLLTTKDRVLVSIHHHYKVGDLDHLTKHILASEVCAPIRSVNRSIAQCIQDGLNTYKEKKFTIDSIEKLEQYVEHFFAM